MAVWVGAVGHRCTGLAVGLVAWCVYSRADADPEYSGEAGRERLCQGVRAAAEPCVSGRTLFVAPPTAFEVWGVAGVEPFVVDGNAYGVHAKAG